MTDRCEARSIWIAPQQLSKIAAVSQQAANGALRKAHSGNAWRGHELMVKRVHGVGGQAGWSYVVRLDSLPAELQDRWWSLHGDAGEAEEIRPGTSRAAEIAQWRFEVIEGALNHPSRTAERASEIRRAAAVVRSWPGGKRGPVHERTIYLWIAAYEERGMAGLRQARRADHGARKVLISRTWDKAVPFDRATMLRIAEAAEKDVRSLWAANLSCGWKWIASLAEQRLIEETAGAGFDPGKAELKRICRLPRNFVDRGRPYRAVAIHDMDRKRHDDHSRPRVKRTLAGRAPMSVVIGDVHPLDILFRRPDGSICTPKLIAWMDWATGRVFHYPVFLPKGRGVRMEDVAEAYIAMIKDRGWGLPETLYLDNGGEYNWASFIEDAQTLNTQARYVPKTGGLADEIEAQGRSIVKAQPYNAAAKPIEGAFGVLERTVFSMLPGWIGGDRMKKKTANVGREPVPFPGDEAELREALRVAFAAYHDHPQDGLLGGLSPNAVFARAVEEGWRRMDVDENALRSVFARQEPRQVRQGRVSFGGQSYTCPELQRLPAGTHVTLRVPLFGDRSQLPVLDERQELLGVAVRDQAYDILDPAGAREARQRLRESREGIRRLRADVEPVDTMDRLGALASNADTPPEPESAGTVRLADMHQRIGRELIKGPAGRELEEDARHQRKLDEQSKAIERVLEKVRANG